MHRKIFYWKLRDRELQLGERTLVMGVLNVTPDSFSDAGIYSDPDRAYARALAIEEQGADILDIGAESTRPGAEPVSADEEWRRLVPLLKKLRGALSIPVSLDTYKSETAERALQYDVQILNDPSGLTFDVGLAKIAAEGNLGLVLNHMRGRPEQWAKLGPMPDPVGTVSRELEAAVSRARHDGVDRNRIVIDPGIGFGKRKEQNSEILAQLYQLHKLDFPLLVGVSRKSFLAQSTERDTMFATAAAVTASILNGAHLVRVHDVKEMMSVVRVADEIARSAAPEPEIQTDRPASKGRQAAKLHPWEEPKAQPTRPPIRRPEAISPPRPLTPANTGAPETREAVIGAPEENKPAPVEAENSETLSPQAQGETAPIEKPPIQKTPFEKPPARKTEAGRSPGKFDRVPKTDRPAGPGRFSDKRPFERRSENPYRKPGGGGPPDRRRNDDRPKEQGAGRPEDRPFGGDRPFRKGGDRGPGPFRSGPPRGARPGSERPGSERPGGARPGSERSGSSERPGTGRPGGRKPRGEGPGGGKSGFRPGGKTGGGKPGGNPLGNPRGNPGANRGPKGPRKPFRKP